MLIRRIMVEKIEFDMIYALRSWPTEITEKHKVTGLYEYEGVQYVILGGNSNTSIGDYRVAIPVLPRDMWPHRVHSKPLSKLTFDEHRLLWKEGHYYEGYLIKHDGEEYVMAGYNKEVWFVHPKNRPSLSAVPKTTKKTTLTDLMNACPTCGGLTKDGACVTGCGRC